MITKLKKIFKKNNKMDETIQSALKDAILIIEENIEDFELKEYYSGNPIKINEKLLLCTLQKEDNSLEIIRVRDSELGKKYEILEKNDEETHYFLRVKLVN